MQLKQIQPYQPFDGAIDIIKIKTPGSGADGTHTNIDIRGMVRW